MWRTERTSLFTSSYKKLSSELQARTDCAVRTLARSESPADLWIQKKGRFRGYLAYNMGRSYRLIYKVCIMQNVILLIVVGDHKSVYGRD